MRSKIKIELPLLAATLIALTASVTWVGITLERIMLNREGPAISKSRISLHLIDFTVSRSSGHAGLLVTSVSSGGVADRAGIKAGDFVEQAGDRPVRALSDITALLRSATIGAVRLRIRRHGSEKIVMLSSGN